MRLLTRICRSRTAAMGQKPPAIVSRKQPSEWPHVMNKQTSHYCVLLPGPPFGNGWRTSARANAATPIKPM